MWVLSELQGAQLERLASDPTPASTGRTYFNTVSGLPKFYDGSAWRTLTYLTGARTVTGTRNSPTAIVAGTGVTPAAGNSELQFIQGSGGAVTVSANPQIAAGTVVGQEIELFGCSDTNTVAFSNGTGLSLNGNWTAEADTALRVTWDGALWQETSRR